MRMLMAVGLILIIVGLVLLFVPIPHRARHGIQAGSVSLGVETTTSERLNPGVGAVIIAGGVVLMIVGRSRR